MREIDDEHPTPLVFSCYEGVCGTCLVRVVEGMENLSPRTETERILLEVLVPDSPDRRLACQLRISGPVVVVPAPV